VRVYLTVTDVSYISYINTYNRLDPTHARVYLKCTDVSDISYIQTYKRLDPAHARVYLRCVGRLANTLSYKFRSKCTTLFSRAKLN
jgi:hypothetical protein